MSHSIATHSLASGSSPIKKTRQGSSFYDSQPPKADKLKMLMADEMKRQWVGPMPLEQFFKEFLPVSKSVIESSPSSSLPKDYFNALPIYKLEREMYDPFIALVHAASLMPGFKLVNTADFPDKTSEDGKKLHCDVTVYDEDLEVSEHRTQYDETELQIEMKKPNTHSDPFRDPPDNILPELRPQFDFEDTGIEHTYTRGQIVTYNTEWSNRQHRIHTFTIFLGDPYARFIVADRSGGIVSKRFNFRENSKPLIDFFWCFAHLTPAQRGFDTTVRKATPIEVELAKPLLARWVPEKERLLVAVSVPDGAKKYREVIAWGAMGNAESLTGRATRAWPAYDPTEKKVVFLKDTWRSLLPGMEKESAILRELNEKKVRHVPRLVCGDDIPGQETRSHTFAVDSWRCGPVRLTPRAHHRFTEDFIGTHLKEFTSSKQLLRAVYHAFLAHRDAYVECGILHRDISGQNVLLTADGNGGILNDWDMAKRVSLEDDSPRTHARTGTWHFMSSLLLQNPGRKHELQDDLESFVQLVLYHGLLYLRHNRTNSLRYIIENVFEDTKIMDDGTLVGGLNKEYLFTTRKFIQNDFEFTDSPQLTRWLGFGLGAVGKWIMACLPPVDDSESCFFEGALLAEVEATPAPVVDKTKLALFNHDVMGKSFGLMLDSGVWPENDKVPLQLRKIPKQKMNTVKSLLSTMTSTSLSTMTSTSMSSVTSSSSKRTLQDVYGAESGSDGRKTKKSRRQSKKASSLRRTTSPVDSTAE